MLFLLLDYIKVELYGDLFMSMSMSLRIKYSLTPESAELREEHMKLSRDTALYLMSINKISHCESETMLL